MLSKISKWKEFMHSISITIDIYNIVIGFIILFAIFGSHINQHGASALMKPRRWYQIITILNILVSVSDILILVFPGPSRPENFIIFPVAMFSIYLLTFIYIPATGLLILSLVEQTTPQKKSEKLMRLIFAASGILFIIFLSITPFTNFLYEIDDNNNLIHRKFYCLTVILQIIMYISLIIYMIAKRKIIKKMKASPLVCFVLLPELAQIFQRAIPGVSLISAGYSLIFIIMFICSNSIAEQELEDTTNKLDEIENEMLDKSTEIEKNKLKIIRMQDHTIESLSNLVENRDEDTGEHVLRTREYVELVAVQMMKDGYYPEILTPRYIRLLKRAAPMHDIGKIVVPDAILKKPGRLTPEEYEQMKRHASEGGRIVHQILDGYETLEYIQITADIATHHHERWDGNGYPQKLSGEAIPFSARIMAISDVFDALVSPRVYKLPMSYDEAFALIEEGMGTQFDPDIAKEFLKIKEKAIAINERYKIK